MKIEDLFVRQRRVQRLVKRVDSLGVKVCAVCCLGIVDLGRSELLLLNSSVGNSSVDLSELFDILGSLVAFHELFDLFLLDVSVWHVS